MAHQKHNTRCSVDGCESPYKAKGFCNAHYRRMLRHGFAEFPTRYCSVEGCEEVHYGNGLCRLHHLRQWRGTPLDAPIRGRDRICSVEGCENKRRRMALCELHYKRHYGWRLRQNIPAIIQKQGYICPVCGEWLTGDLMDGTLFHVDHIFPRSKGGSDELSNLQVTHAKCNMRKWAHVLPFNTIDGCK